MRGGGKLAAGFVAFEDERRKVSASGVNRRREPGATGADNDHFLRLSRVGGELKLSRGGVSSKANARRMRVIDPSSSFFFIGCPHPHRSPHSSRDEDEDEEPRRVRDRLRPSQPPPATSSHGQRPTRSAILQQITLHQRQEILLAHVAADRAPASRRLR